jgi:hypothetical protein
LWELSPVYAYFGEAAALYIPSLDEAVYVGDLPVSDLLGGRAVEITSQETKDSFWSYLGDLP